MPKPLATGLIVIWIEEMLLERNPLLHLIIMANLVVVTALNVVIVILVMILIIIIILTAAIIIWPLNQIAAFIVHPIPVPITMIQENPPIITGQPIQY